MICRLEKKSRWKSSGLHCSHTYERRFCTTPARSQQTSRRSSNSTSSLSEPSVHKARWSTSLRISSLAFSASTMCSIEKKMTSV